LIIFKSFAGEKKSQGFFSVCKIPEPDFRAFKAKYNFRDKTISYETNPLSLLAEK
jgi:hypothetical protein